MAYKIRIEKGTVQETLIVPLFARKKCTDTFPQLYTDPEASRICDRLEYDFSALDKLYEKTIYEFGALEAAVRQLDIMQEIREYVSEHPDASIVCMGCGLDFDARRCGIYSISDHCRYRRAAPCRQHGVGLLLQAGASDGAVLADQNNAAFLLYIIVPCCDIHCPWRNQKAALC